jgi:hypothetical protein
MSSLQRQRWPDAEGLRKQLAEVTAAADAIQASRPLLDQTAALRTFFGRASDAVQEMANQQRTS